MDFERLFKDEAFKNIEQERLQAIKNLAEESEGKSMQEVMMIMMKYSKVLNSGRKLSKSETDAMMNVLFKNLGEEERERFKSIIKLVEMM